MYLCLVHMIVHLNILVLYIYVYILVSENLPSFSGNSDDDDEDDADDGGDVMADAGVAIVRQPAKMLRRHLGCFLLNYVKNAFVMTLVCCLALDVDLSCIHVHVHLVMHIHVYMYCIHVHVYVQAHRCIICTQRLCSHMAYYSA